MLEFWCMYKIKSFCTRLVCMRSFRGSLSLQIIWIILTSCIQFSYFTSQSNGSMLTVCWFFSIYFFKIYTFADVIFFLNFFYENGSPQLQHTCNSHLNLTFLIRFEFDHFDLWSKYSHVICIYSTFCVTVYTQMVRSALPYHLTDSLSIFILDSRSNNNVNAILQCDKIQWHIRIKYEHAVANQWRNHINLQWMTTEKQLSHTHVGHTLGHTTFLQ